MRNYNYNTNNNHNSTSGGVGVMGLLGVAFVVLKLLGVINWPWVWVLCPFWIGLAVIILVGVVLIIVAAIKDARRKRR